ncbi:MAG: DUF3575 domain-containing protein, partial [Bacteroides sp.]|nr:DUF3575 domain-containing protein [Bacteroides sp.]MBD5339676.1 DUF3575 domain-containing protein [Bacteroides sp.]
MKLSHGLIALCMMLGASPGLRAETVGIKTNLLGWAVTNPNLGLEIGVAHRSTISLTGSLNPWNFSDERHLKSWMALPEYRYWFCE